MRKNRAVPPIPYEYLAEVPTFTVTSNDISDGAPLDERHVASPAYGLSGENLSPHLGWEGFPAETRSFAVTCFDPDAPTGSGFWHWVLFDVPASVTELDRGVAIGGEGPLSAAIEARNDAGASGYVGAFPPAGHGPHRYVYAVHALDTDSLGIDGSASPAYVGFNLSAHVIARAVIVPTYEVPADA